MDKIYSAADFVSALLDNIGDASKFQEAQKITNTWKDIVCGIKAPGTADDDPNRGEKMYSHSKVLDLKNGVLLIETDHPGWTQLFHIHRKYILTRLARAMPELKITALSFKLKKGID